MGTPVQGDLVLDKIDCALNAAPLAPNPHIKTPLPTPMKLFNIWPGFQQSPAGRERAILRSLPRALWLCTAVPALAAGLARVFPWSGSETDIATRIQTVDILAISVVIFLWSMVLTVAIAAFIVRVMKGPAYVADAYPLQDAERPAPPDPAPPR